MDRYHIIDRMTGRDYYIDGASPKEAMSRLFTAANIDGEPIASFRQKTGSGLEDRIGRRGL